MRQRPKTLGFAFLLTLLAALHVGRSADAASVSRRCRRACGDQVAACVAGGGRARACRKSLLERCQQEGVAVCQGQAGQFSAALAGDCSSPTVVPAQGGTFSGTTSGASALAGSCGNSDGSPEQVFRWTPTVSGTATIQTCGAGTTFDTVLYLRSGVCASGPEVAAGCNDDACANASGLNRASRVTPMVTAGQTYFIVVDGYSGTQGNFTLTVVPPGLSSTTTLRPPQTTTTTTRPATVTTTTLRATTTTTTTRPPTTTTTTRAGSSTTTTLPPPTGLTATAPSCSEIDLRWTLSSGTVSGYNVYRKASTATTFTLAKQVGATPVFPVADTALGASTTYTYGVTAWDSASTSTMPTVLTNTPGCPVTVNPTLTGFVPGVGTPTDVAVDSATSR